MAKLTMRMVRRELQAVGVTIKNDTEWGEYVVRIKGSAPDEGYHTSDLADAYQTGHAMALDDERTRDAAVRHADIYGPREGQQAMVNAARNKQQISRNERAKRDDEAMLGLPRGSIKN